MSNEQADPRPPPQVVPIEWPPKPEILDMLATFNKFAQDGKLEGLAIVGVWRNGAISSAFHAGGETLRMLGALSYLSARLNGWLADVPRDPDASG